MALTPGTTLGPYAVTAKIGEGGMGQVYRATDTTLDRDVAIKVLPDAFASDPERLARFEREAKVLASLNHLNIGAIYGLEKSGDTRALVLELVEGPTLADRIKQGPIPLDEALPIAKQIAEALEAAHEQGVIHRDLKPANVKVKDDGTVKVLDFGLAKAFQPDASDPSLSASPTISLTAAATQMGMVIGTAAYMAPEQAKGKPIDKRADVWAFGAVLYEMLTGQKVFAGGDVSDTLAFVLTKDIDWTTLPADVPESVHHLLRRCLERNPQQRLRDIGEARIGIESSGMVPVAIAAETKGESQLPVWQRPLVVLATIVTVALLTALAVWGLTRPGPQAVSRFELPLRAEESFSGLGRHAVAVSPDGRQIVYVTTNGLSLRSLDEVTPVLMAGTDENARAPFFSPDGQWIGFFDLTGRQLQKVATRGGAPVTLGDAANPWGASWGADDMILYGQGPEGIWRMPGTGGTPETLITVEEGELAHGPQMLPGGEWVLFTLSPAGAASWDTAQIVVQSLVTSERVVLIEEGRDARYVETGHLVYALNEVVFAVAFDLDAREVLGRPVSLVEGVRSSPLTGAVQFAHSDNGSLAYVLGRSASSDLTLALVGRNGVVEPLNVPPARYLTPRLSPDGEKLVVQTAEDDGNVLWIYDLSDDTQIQQLTFEGDNERPVWTPDSQRITFSSDRDGTMSLYWIPADGSGVAERLTTADEGTFHWPGTWLPDGQTLLFSVQRNLANDWDIWTLSSSGRETQSLYDAPDTIYLGPELSSNGEWLAYGAGSEAGTVNIYVEPFPPTGSRHRITQNVAYYPLWSPDGDRLFYRPIATSTGITLRSVDVVTEPEFAFSNEQTLPIEGFNVVGYYRGYDITPDGERFVMVFPADQTEGRESSRPKIDIVLNWHQELLERVPIP